MASPEISIVIPARNERDNIRPLVAEIQQVMDDSIDYEIVYVDDGSTDDTYAEICRLRADCPRLRAVGHQASVGQSTAILSGVIAARGHLIVTLDADGQNDPADIPALLAHTAGLADGRHFCICGYRRKRKGDTPWKRFQSRVANRVRSRLLHDGTPDTGCGLKVFARNSFLAMPYFDHMHRFIPALIRRLGGEIRVVEVNHRERIAGQSNYSMWNRLWVGLVDMAGVMWLQRRNKPARIRETTD